MNRHVFVDAIVDGGQKLTEASARGGRKIGAAVPLPGRPGVYHVVHRYPSRPWPRCRSSLTFPGNYTYQVSSLDSDDWKSFDCDYNNLFFYHVASRTPLPPGEQTSSFPGDPFRGVETKRLVSIEGSKFIASLTDWRQRTGLDAHSIFRYPKYANPNGDDYRPVPDSPNIAAGENGTTIGALAPDSAPPRKELSLVSGP
jgi:hypothetical protein